MIKLSEDLKENPLYITMEKCLQYTVVSVLSQSSYQQKIREKDLQISSYIEVSAQESLCKAEKHIEI